MINIGIRYVNKDRSEGVILAGDKGVLNPVGGKELILECDTLHIMDEFPIVFAPAGAAPDSAVVSNFITKIILFLYERFQPKKFSVFEFTNSFPEFHKELSRIHKSYFTEEEIRNEEVKFDFDFILAGSDRDGATFLYYGRIAKYVAIADIRLAPGYVTSLCGSSEGMAFLKEILQDREIPRDVAIETAISILELLRRIQLNMSENFQLYSLENGEIQMCPDENIAKIRGLMDYRWNALWVVLKNALDKPKYLDYVLDKLGG